MDPGSIVTPVFVSANIYESIGGRYMGTMAWNSIGIVVDFDYSPSDVPYCKVLAGGLIGWIQQRNLREVGA